MANATEAKFGDPVTRIAQTDCWTVLLRPKQPTFGSLVLVCREPVQAFSEVSARAFADLQGVIARIEAVLRARPAEDWLAAFRAAAVPAGPINDVAEAFALAESLGMEPVRESGGYPLPTPPLRLDGERPAIRRPPPELDEHGAELRRWLAAD